MSNIVTIRIDRFNRHLPQLVSAIATVGDVTLQALASRSQDKWLVALRQAIAIAAHEVLDKAYNEIARELGRRDSKTVWFACSRARSRCDTDSEFRQLVDVTRAIARAIAGREPPGPDIEPELPLWTTLPVTSPDIAELEVIS